MIQNLEEIIFKEAQYLFSYEGYDNVDMKAIAKKCNIAVGTLYNYYGNKKDLFLKVFSDSWSNTISKIKSAFQSQDKNKEIITILYFDIKERRGLGSNLINSTAFSKEENTLINSNIISEIIKLIAKDSTYNYGKLEKVVHIIIYNIVLLANLYPENDEDNIAFLLGILNNNII